MVEELKKIILDDYNSIFSQTDNSNLIEKLKNDRKKILLALSKIYKSKKILIIGDKDVDGITSTTMMAKTIKNIKGEREIHTYIPSRYDGYSLNVNITSTLLKNKTYDLIIHLDNGSSYETLNAIKEKQLEDKYIIIDHHPIDEIKEFPEFVINPNISGNVSTSTGLIVGYIYDFLYKYNKHTKIFKEEWEEGIFDEVRALSALADMVDKNSLYNRNIIKKGIEKIKTSPYYLYKNVEIEDVINYLSFKIIPLINAVGRIASNEDLNNIDFNVLFFEKEDINKFKEEFKKLEYFNSLRKEATEFFTKLAFNEYQENKDLLNGVFVFYHDNMPIGINGLVAQKIYQTTGTPTICLSPNPVDPTIIYGSGRGKNLKNFIKQIKKENPELLFEFGGHQDAFGISVNAFNIDEVIKVFKNQKFKIEKKEEDLTINYEFTDSELLEVMNFYKEITDDIPLDKDYKIKFKYENIALLKKYNDLYALAMFDDLRGLINPETFNKLLDLSNKSFIMKLPYGIKNIAFDIDPLSFNINKTLKPNTKIKLK